MRNARMCKGRKEANIINSMNFKNSKRTDPHRVLLNLTGKINFKRND